MRHTCPDNLVFGKKCRTEADCIYLYKICPDYKRSPEVSDEMRSMLQAGLTTCKLCNLPFMHDRGDDTFVHIKPTCVNVTNNRPCPRQPGCPFGHDFETLRKALHQHRLRIARRNTMLNGWRTHQARVRQESIKGQTGEHATGRR